MKKLKCKEYRYFNPLDDYEEVPLDKEWYLLGFVSVASDIYAVVECPKKRTLKRVRIDNIKMISYNE